jgi:hypothetical protein
MEWLFWLFLSFLAWILGYLILKSPLLSLLPAGLTSVLLGLFSKVFSVTISKSQVWIIWLSSAIFLILVFYLKPSVAKTALSSALISIFVGYGVGLIINAYLSMIP